MSKGDIREILDIGYTKTKSSFEELNIINVKCEGETEDNSCGDNGDKGSEEVTQV